MPTNTKTTVKALNPLPMLNEAEVATLTDRLQLHCANLRAMAQAKGKTPPNAPTLSGSPEGLLDDADALIAHGSALEDLLGASAPEFVGVMPKNEASRQLAAHPAFAPAPTPAPAAAASAPTAPAPEIIAAQLQRDGSCIVTVKLARPSATERLLAAEGVKTLSELAQKRERKQAAKYSANANRIAASRPKKSN